MALPASGTLSMSQIATEIGAANGPLSLRGMSQSAGKTSPDKISDFYSYAQTWYYYAITFTYSCPSGPQSSATGYIKSTQSTYGNNKWVWSSFTNTCYKVSGAPTTTNPGGVIPMVDATGAGTTGASCGFV